MLTLTAEQHAALAADAARRFRLDAIAHIRRCLPDVYARDGDQKVAARVDAALERARAHGLADACSLLLFLNLSYLLGDGFEDDPARPWISDVLRDYERPASDRMTAVETRIYAELGLG